LEYDRMLRQDLYEKGIKDGDITILCDMESWLIPKNNVTL
jgi:hypothetical protein